MKLRFNAHGWLLDDDRTPHGPLVRGRVLPTRTGNQWKALVIENRAYSQRIFATEEEAKAWLMAVVRMA